MGKPSAESEYALLSYPGAELRATLVQKPESAPEIRFFGNRRGILSLANLLLWLKENQLQVEVLPVTALTFVRTEGTLSFAVRILLADGDGGCGAIRGLDKGSQYEWQIAEDDLEHVALILHRLACFPAHEFDFFPYEDDRVADARLHVRLVDVRDYL